MGSPPFSNIMKHVDLMGLHVDTATGATVVLLREHEAPHRVLPIFIGGGEAASIAIALSGDESPRPLSHDVMTAFVEGVGAHLDAVEVTDLHDGAFTAELAFSGYPGELRIDSRPSDAIALAVRVDAPLFVADAVLDEAGTVLNEILDEQDIDHEVAEFRTQLDGLDPSDFDDDAPSNPGASFELTARPGEEGSFAGGRTRTIAASVGGEQPREPGTMKPDPIDAQDENPGGSAHQHATPDSATWDTHEDAEIELIGEHEPFDEVDLADESWAPGQPPPGMPVEEVLHVHSLTEREAPADELEVGEEARDDLDAASDELFEGEEGEES